MWEVTVYVYLKLRLPNVSYWLKLELINFKRLIKTKMPPEKCLKFKIWPASTSILHTPAPDVEK